MLTSRQSLSDVELGGTGASKAPGDANASASEAGRELMVSASVGDWSPVASIAQRKNELFLACTVLAFSFALSLLPVLRSELPEAATVTLTGVTHTLPTSAVSYPVSLDGVWCYADEINDANNSCGNGDKTAFMQIPNWLLGVLGPLLAVLSLLFLDRHLHKSKCKGIANGNNNSGSSGQRDTHETTASAGGEKDTNIYIIPTTYASAATYPFSHQTRAARDGTMGLVLSMAILALITNTLKQVIGRPRPNMAALIALDAVKYVCVCVCVCVCY